MGLKTTLAKCESVRSCSLDKTPESRSELDILNIAISMMLENKMQKDAIMIACKRIPLAKPFVVMLLELYIKSDVCCNV